MYGGFIFLLIIKNKLSREMKKTTLASESWLFEIKRIDSLWF